jgi:hypothetical protein
MDLVDGAPFAADIREAKALLPKLDKVAVI